MTHVSPAPRFASLHATALPSLLVAALTLGLGASSGCGKCRSGNCSGAAPPPPNGAITIKPQGLTFNLTGNAAHQPFTATVGMVDVTNQVQWLLDPDDADVVTHPMVGGVFDTKAPPPHCGPIRFSAAYKATGQFASAVATLNCTPPDVLGEGVIAVSHTAFEPPYADVSRDPSEAVSLLYPLEQAMVPRNLKGVDFQWTGGAQDRYFRLHAKSDYIEMSFILLSSKVCQPIKDNPGQVKCRYQPRDSDWALLAVTASKSDPTRGGSLQFDLCGKVELASPQACATRTLFVSPEDVRGGFYYFSPTARGIKRTPFGSSQALNFITRENNKADCVGCHALSADGKKLAATFRGSDGLGGIVTADSSSPSMAPGRDANYIKSPYTGGAQARWNFATFSPDGKYLLANWAGELVLYNGITGVKKTTLTTDIVGGPAIMPEWSPDGSAVVFVQVPPEGKLGKDFAETDLVAGDWVAGNAGNIAVMRFDAPNEGFAKAKVIVNSTPQGEYHYFPTWSPDSRWVVFESATYPGHSPSAGINIHRTSPDAPKGYCMAYDQDTARLRIVSADGGNVVDLQAATHIPNKTTSWPKFAPFQQTNLVFVTFSAKFDYGWTVTDGQTPQLWMSAIDLSKLGGSNATDPSYAPVWLPFQNPAEKNHSGIWTQVVSCATPTDCPSDFTCDETNHNCVKIAGGF